MPFFSLDRDLVFTPEDRPIYLVGDFPDFYALLHVRRTAPRAELENAILEAGSQMLAATLARGKSERVALLERYLPLLRRALLDATARDAYNALLHRHEGGQASPGETDAFFKSLRDQESRGEDRDWTLGARPLSRFWRRTRTAPEDTRLGSETA